MKIANWSDGEVKDLFNEVEACKKNQNPLRYAFEQHAKKYCRKPNSVRNYYYHEVDNLMNDDKRCKTLGVDIQKHLKTHFDNFNKIQEEQLFEDIDKLTKQGYSVRSACLKLSANNLTQMTRFQNKYQNMKKRLSGKENIIQFRQRQKSLTENDINSLFMGLVRLIKKTAVEDFLERNKKEKEASGFLLKKAFVDLQKKDRQIAELREEFERLRLENSQLTKKINDLTENKQEKLKRHLEQKHFQTSLEN